MSNPNEQLAKALYEEWQRVSYPSVLVYPWEQLCHTMPNLAAGWLAVADMAVLNLCEAPTRFYLNPKCGDPATIMLLTQEDIDKHPEIFQTAPELNPKCASTPS